MATSNYMTGRQRFFRPQAIVWTDSIENIDGLTVPIGVEGSDFLILSDHGRSELSIAKERIENRKRTINAHMRSYHIADKRNVSFDWEMIPSRAYSNNPLFSPETGKQTSTSLEYTADGGAGGVELIDWYENHQNSFYMMLAYDKYNEFNSLPYTHLNKYNEIIEVHFASFEYNIVRRGSTNTHDFFNISVSLEEV